MRDVAARVAAVIRVDEIWLAVDPLDMRAGFDTALGRVVKVFGAAHPHHAYLFTNRRANRLKVLVHDGIGIWLAARRLNEGRFVWPHAGSEPKRSCSRTSNWRAWCSGCRGSASAKMA
ncbi:IS66 family insertion sequence element accessory protein TnpB [Caballeronia sp. CLC5]|uniref:IS66 family insertion sequence element accessory protein TnpB n=1 Tax=Caballeronia sp. CLC5 TaxID=2906764 RepID=UPI001F2D532A|nr:IS66 family insertion sequence element accessory protein TnpB [Caballeronia sp. CLC5]MCE4573514.1 IS66 family insertion sequence element accessory protein TnpB [Caballeronia sp. CLC5]